MKRYSCRKLLCIKDDTNNESDTLSDVSSGDMIDDHSFMHAKILKLIKSDKE